MPGPEFFRNLGLFVADAFLSRAVCTELCDEMRRGRLKPGKIVLPTGEDITNESVRRTLRAKVEADTERLIQERLQALQPRLERHFGVSLAGSERPEFLIYNKRGFYGPHTDATRESHASIQCRRVSIVVFLNQESVQPAENCYVGGKLTFHRIFNEPQWANCAFSLDSHPGLLVAFRSDLLHEVKPVTFGQRFTLVSWFVAPRLQPNLQDITCGHRVGGDNDIGLKAGQEPPIM
jgi:SM-20-related protein